jgi:hypothetical protein
MSNYESRTEPSDCHLIVLAHGLWGISDHFKYVEETLIKSLATKYPDKVFKTYKTISNEKFKTYDGIDLCGSRVAAEIIHETALLLQNSNFRVTEISIVGYSLGGLITRFAIGVLAAKKYFESVTPINYVTFCTPHVGVLTPGDSFSIKCFNNFVPYLLGNSGKQMFLKDSVTFDVPEKRERIPLLKLMAMENSIFIQALKLFKHHALYSNVRSDIRTCWWTSGISFINPFEILDKNPSVKIDDNGFIHFTNGAKFELSFVDGYDPILLDVNKPIKFTGLVNYDAEKKSGKSSADILKENDVGGYDDSNNSSYIKSLFARKFKWVILIFNSVIYVPMWMTWFILFNILQVCHSFFRVTRESSKLKDNSLIYKLVDQVTNISSLSASTTPLMKPCLNNEYERGLNKLENEVHDQGDFFLDSVFDAITSSKDMDQTIFNQQSHGDKILSTSINKICSIPIDDIENWEDDYKLLGKTHKEAFEYYQILKPFKMNMSPVQREIIKGLNTIRWNKYPVYITKTNATHAAAIFRHEDPAFEEGKAVVEHFCEKTFKVY